MPATDPYCPFLEHAPSVYTTSSLAADIDDPDVAPDGPATTRDLAFEGPEAGCNLESDWTVGADLAVDDDEDSRTCPLGCDKITALA
jgi:hypothetical protein